MLKIDRGVPSRFDAAFFIALAMYGVIVLGTLLSMPMHFLPAEDAVILHQYSRNVAEHGAISYYADGPHTEGATDFAWMMLVAGAMRLGCSPEWFTSIVNVVCLLALASLLLRLSASRFGLLPLLAVVGTAGLVPQIVAAGAGFAVLPDALLLTALVVTVLEERTVAAACVAFFLCLFRPDGVVFAVPLLCLLLKEKEFTVKRLLVVLGFFMIPGALYFAWRVHYFGEWFPLPFLVKADVHRTLGVLVPHSFWQSSKYLLFAGVLLTGLFCGRAIRIGLLICLLAVPTLFYWAMRLDQNVGDRFFFYLPLSIAIVLAAEWQAIEAGRKRLLLRTGAAAFVVLLLGPLLREIRSFRDYQFRDVQQIASGLQQLSTRGSLMTTEAGLLAYGSQWIAYDAWGLNTAEFAKHFIQPRDVVRLRPDLIVLHPDMPEPCTAEATWPSAYEGRTWLHMTRNMVLGAKDVGSYELWLLSYGSDFYRLRKHWQYGEGDRECFLVNRNSPRYAGIVLTLQEHHAKPAGTVR